jgi:hypothetical protein
MAERRHATSMRSFKPYSTGYSSPFEAPRTTPMPEPPERIEALGPLSEDQLAAIDQAWWTNGQLYGGVLPRRAMQRVYTAHSKPWPPAGQPRHRLPSQTKNPFKSPPGNAGLSFGWPCAAHAESDLEVR